MLTIAELKAVSLANDNHFFDRKTMKFWNSKIHGGIRGGKYFITSEDNFDRSRRLFTVRMCYEDGDIGTVGEFQAYRTIHEARAAIDDLLKGEK